MNNTPRNNIRLEIPELETLVGIIETHLGRQQAVVLDEEQLAKYLTACVGCCLRNAKNKIVSDDNTQKGKLRPIQKVTTQTRLPPKSGLQEAL